ncbi:hypothetical protein D5086_000723 [Populus alba]|uniref:Uncharacterized protein n=1 Tax=Populus alba TaxID=43335 RepID=A0ACC4CX55_POPAL
MRSFSFRKKLEINKGNQGIAGVTVLPYQTGEGYWFLVQLRIVMVTEEPKDPFKGVDWKAIGGELQKDPSAGTKPIIKKRLPKKIRQIPDYYFLPRLPLPTAIAFYGACIAGGVGAGMLLEMWINKKVKGNIAIRVELF